MNALTRAVAVVVSLSLFFGPVLHAAPPGTTPIHEELRQQLAHFDVTSPQPVNVIVTLASEPAAVTGAKAKERGQSAAAARDAQLNRIRTERGNVFSHLRRLGIEVSPRHEFELVINGFSLTLPANQLPLLASVPGVTGIFENVAISGEDLSESAVMNVSGELAVGVPAVGAPAMWNAGFRGNGILVAIIDDGVDYTHPDLGGCFGPGCKVVGGYDFIDLDADPNSGRTGAARDYHGTHVAAIAAGTKGVAPDANILAIRVLGTNTSGKTSNLDTVMAGAEYAVRHQVHVVNMSIGFRGVASSSANLYAQVVENVVRTGVVWVNSNGNDGPTPYIPNMYGAAPSAIATGNADARPTSYPRTVISATGEALIGGGYGTPFPAALLGPSLPVVDVGFGNTPAYYAGKDVAGKVALALRGGAAGEDAGFVNKSDQALAAGAAAIIIYNDAARAVDFSIPETSLPSFSMSHANGLKVIANPLITVANFDPGVQMNSGSSRGPTFDLMIKPDVSAPGTNIVAAVPYEASSTGYASLNGTSMAAPHAAGAAALLRQKFPEWTPAQVKSALMSTATNLSDLFSQSYRTIDQGAGFVNLSRAMSPSLSTAPASISFGQLLPPELTATREITVTAGATYNVSVSWVRSYSGASLTPSAAAVFPGTSTLAVNAAISSSSPAGEYEGYVLFVNAADPADTYRVPFLFAHSLPVSEVAMSRQFLQSVGTFPDERSTVTFKAGRPLADWYLGTSGGTRFTPNQGATAPGVKSVSWNVRAISATGVIQTLGAGNWIMGVWYKLNATDPAFTFASTASTRFFVDKVAPLIELDGPLPALTNERKVMVRGGVADSGMFTFGEVGGKVLVNGEAADLFPRVPSALFAHLGVNIELAFEKEVTLSEGENAVTVYAEDAAGNRSVKTFSLNSTLDSIPPVVTFTGDRIYLNTEQVVVSCTATDSGSGVAGTPCASPLVDAPAWTFPIGPNPVNVSVFDVAGNVTNASTTFFVNVTFDSLAALTTTFVGKSVGASMLSQLNAARDAAARGNSTAVNGALQAYDLEVDSQIGRSLTAEQAAALKRGSAALRQ
jgi:minor extracellular serine protease Vpr